MVEVIADLRQEEVSVGGLAHIFLPPAQAAPQPAARPKRKGGTTGRGGNKKEPRQYTLIERSQAERERMIADRAAAILSEQSAPDPVGLNDAAVSSVAFLHQKPISEFVRQHLREDSPLWQQASLSDANISTDKFYVNQLRSVLSPAKKKAGYTNILLHASQLPGRNSSQVHTIAFCFICQIKPPVFMIVLFR